MATTNTKRIISELVQPDSILHRQRFFGTHGEVDALQKARGMLCDCICDIYESPSGTVLYELLCILDLKVFENLRKERVPESLVKCRNTLRAILDHIISLQSKIYISRDRT